jgi:hypothetical protein
MSYQYEIEAEIYLTEEGIKIVELYNSISFKDVGEREVWSVVGDTYPVVAKYGSNDRADFIPRGAYGSIEPVSNFVWNYWQIHCSTPDRSNEIQAFLELIPLISKEAFVSVKNDDRQVTDYQLSYGKMIELKKEKYDDWDYPMWGY